MLKDFNGINFTEKANKAIVIAEEEARSLGSNVVGTEHLLLGLCTDAVGIAGMVLQQNDLRPDRIRTSILRLVNQSAAVRGTYTGEMYYTIACERVIKRSKETALHYGHDTVGTEHLLVSIFREIDSIAVRVLIDMNIEPTQLFKDIVAMLQTDEFTADLQKQKRVTDDIAPMELLAVDYIKNGGEEVPFLIKYGTDMTKMAAEGKYDKIIGREEEMKRVLQILGRKTKNNPCLVGEPGVGKTAIVEGLAQLIAEGNVPDGVRNKRIISIDLSGLVSGTKYRGEFEERFKRVIAEAKEDKDIVLFFDELHTIIGTGNAEGSLDAANILKPELSRGYIKVIGSTTLREYRKYIEKDPALERRFQPLQITEPDEEQAVKILQGIRGVYEKYHGVTISEEAIRAAVHLSKRYINDRFLPDKAIDLIDEAASAKHIVKDTPSFRETENEEAKILELREKRDEAMLLGEFDKAADYRKQELALRKEMEQSGSGRRKEDRSAVTENDISEVVSTWTGIPLSKLDVDEAQRLLHIEAVMHKRVIGQEEAVSSVAKAIRRGRTGLKDPKKPVGSFIFLGPTGVGKTEVCRALAEALFGDEHSLIRFDMSEYMEAHSVSKLIGSPPGYVGFSDEPILSQKVRNQPYSVVLFDEIEKAHPDIFNILLQILDEGQITDAKGRQIDFKNTVIIMTSNVGARNITEPKTLGFTQYNEAEKYERMKSGVNEELKRTFKPEFLNRIDDILVFKQLTKEEIRRITDILIAQLEARAAANGIRLKIDDDAANYIAEKGYSPLYGARPIKRLLQNEIEDKVAELVLSSKQKEIHISAKDGAVVVVDG
ncbi:MAG: ATP-dependent Clp protease ATP-binding subunit [Clostridia bacterium]